MEFPLFEYWQDLWSVEYDRGDIIWFPLFHYITCNFHLASGLTSLSLWLTILCFFRAFLLCCGSVTKSCLILCDPVDYSTSTVSRSLFKFMPIESVMPSNHLILCYLTSFSRLLQSHSPGFPATSWVTPSLLSGLSRRMPQASILISLFSLIFLSWADVLQA